RVDDQRLDEGEADQHRGEDLRASARVAGDAVERGGRSAALTETTAERGEAEAEARGEGDVAVVRGEAMRLDDGGLRRPRGGLGERDRAEGDEDEQAADGREQDLGRALHVKSPWGRAGVY